MLAHFPNLYIGITGIITKHYDMLSSHLCFPGVITYSSNLNTAAVIREMTPSGSLRIVLETDAPFMVPGNIYQSLPTVKGKRLPLCHTAMIPWTAEFVARIASEVGGSWNLEDVMRLSRSNARNMYGI